MTQPNSFSLCSREHLFTRLASRAVGALLVAGICLAAVATAAAQDSHYWTEQYGNRARLLGGAVIGGNKDLSAVYYNPGALALVENPEILLAGSVFEITNYEVDDADGPQDLSSSSVSLSPSLIAGEARPSFLGENRLAYSFLTRARADIRLPGRADITGDDLGIPKLDFATERLLLDQDMNEFWFGITWAHRLSEKVGAGVTTFLAVRNQRFLAEQMAQALTTADRAAVTINVRDFDYQDWRVLWKLGLATEWEKWELGLSVTTPSVNIGGNGATGYDQSAVGQDVNQDGTTITQMNTNSQRGISSQYKSPVSVGLGAARVFGRTSLNVAAEWFAGVDEYANLRAEPFVGQTSGELIDTSVISDADSVTNVAVGVEFKTSEERKYYGGFRTDFSSNAKGSDSNSSLTGLDLYHVSGGVTFSVRGSDFTTGAILSFGDTEASRILQIPDLVGDRSDAVSVGYFRFTFILGFNFKFN